MKKKTQRLVAAAVIALLIFSMLFSLIAPVFM